ncbi:MAG: purine-nucleoside phosphorylase [Planctomycetaceae bacterium]|nr:purine-nucleoside phosphorylase [Planctomycetaceae bacterium]
MPTSYPPINVQQIDDALTRIRQDWQLRPSFGIILGTGLSRFAGQMNVDVALDYESIPHFPLTTALSHQGRLLCGSVEGVPVVTMDGRFHRYEGYPLSQVALPVRVMKALGVELLMVSNAGGGINPILCSGDVVVIDDHINLMSGSPLIGPNDERLGDRFPDMSAPYDAEISDLALCLARRSGFAAYRGVYAAMTGPNYETRAEYRFLRKIGADVVGMSTVPEVIVARHAGMKVLALSAVTNVCQPDQLTPTSGDLVVAAAESTEPKMRDIVTGVIRSLASVG